MQVHAQAFWKEQGLTCSSILNACCTSRNLWGTRLAKGELNISKITHSARLYSKIKAVPAFSTTRTFTDGYSGARVSLGELQYNISSPARRRRGDSMVRRTCKALKMLYLYFTLKRMPKARLTKRPAARSRSRRCQAAGTCLLYGVAAFPPPFSSAHQPAYERSSEMSSRFSAGAA